MNVSHTVTGNNFDFGKLGCREKVLLYFFDRKNVMSFYIELCLLLDHFRRLNGPVKDPISMIDTLLHLFIKVYTVKNFNSLSSIITSFITCFVLDKSKSTSLSQQQYQRVMC